MNSKETDKIITAALDEDKVFFDITSNLTIPANHKSSAFILCKENAILCGIDIAKRIFRKLDKNIVFKALRKDGMSVRKGDKIAVIKGSTAKILAAERTALNFIAHLSGIATLTNQFVVKTASFKTTILDTRKTTPGLRKLEKYAVICGGGKNHRIDLSENVFIKDNHLQILNTKGTYKELVKIIRQKTHKKLIIEVDNLLQFKKVLEANPDIILLDNMNITDIKKAVLLAKKTNIKPLLEASGGVTLKNISRIARTGIGRVSIGSLTHSAKSIDYSLEMENAHDK